MTAKETIAKKLCKQPPTIQRTFDPSVSQRRMGFILASSLKWVNGTEVKFMFLEGAEAQRKVVRKAFQTWKAGASCFTWVSFFIFSCVALCALTSLKYFCEESPNYHIIAAGGMLGCFVPN